jgi:C-terminal processing protease CtpA/Prc
MPRFDLKYLSNQHIFDKISKNGPADLAGAANGDKIIEFNGQNVEWKSHPELAYLIQENLGKKLSFLVIGFYSAAQMKERSNIEAEIRQLLKLGKLVQF